MKKLIIALAVIAQSALFAQINTMVSVIPEVGFVHSIGGKYVNVSLMVKPGAEPDTYEPKPSQMKEIAKSDVYFAIGVPFENIWLPKFANQNKKMEIVDVGKGVKAEAMPTFMDTKEKADDALSDPHIWMSPETVKVIGLNIYNTLDKLDPAHHEYYKVHYEAFLYNINKMDRKIKKILTDVPKGSKFMIFHPAWGYFAREYHLTQFPIQVEGKDPKPRMLAHIIDIAKKENIKVIFTQPEFSDHVAKTIAQQLNIRVIKATPLATNWEKNLTDFATAIANNQ